MKIKRLISKVGSLVLGIAVMGASMGTMPVQAAPYEPAVGQICLVAFGYTPADWVECDGRSLKVSEYEVLYNLIGTNFGGDGSSVFNVPDLRTATPVKGVRYMMSLKGSYPSDSSGAGFDPVIGQVELFPYNFVPKGWALCNGQVLKVGQYQPLYAVVGTTFGGDGLTFKLPNLQKALPDSELAYYMATTGLFPWEGAYGNHDGMLGTVDLFVTSPRIGDGAECKGTVMEMRSNAALFALLNLQFGGDGRTTFNLPDLRGAYPEKGLSYHMNLQGYFPSRP